MSPEERALAEEPHEGAQTDLFIQEHLGVERGPDDEKLPPL